MVLKITNLHILRYLPTCWLYLLECYTIDNQQCTHTASEFANNHNADAMPLLYNLRDDLRKELNLETLTNTQWICLRITNRDRK